MNPATLQREGLTLKLSGAVNSSTAADLYRDLAGAFGELGRSNHKDEGLILDCSAIEGCDSTAVALLLAARRMAVAHAQALSVAGLGSQLGSLVQLYGVGELLDLPAVI